MKRNIKIKNTLFVSLLIAATTAIITISTFWAYSEVKESKRDRKLLREHSLMNQKEKLKREVNILHDYISYAHKNHQNGPLEELKNEILDYISTIRFGSGGYIFINKTDGQALVYNGNKQIDYLNNLEMKDIYGKYLFEPQIIAFNNKEEGGFMQYHFNRIRGDMPESKISYMRGYHDWDWIIGAGDYLSVIDKEILDHEDELKQKLKTQIITIIVILAMLLIGIAYISYFLSTYINKEFAVFKNYFKHSKTGELIDIDKLTIVELKTIAETANKMINEIDSTTILLKESEEKFRKIIENSADAIFIANEKGNYIYVNKKATELLNYTQKELYSMSISDLASTEDLEKHAGSFEKLTTNGSLHIELNFKKKDNSLLPIDLNAIILPNGNAFGSCRDISKRKLIESELHKYRTKLEELVTNRTQELEEKNIELERFNKLFVGREFRIKELKDKLKRYEK